MFSSLLALAALNVAAVAQTTTAAPPSISAQTTLTVLLGTGTRDFAASIVSANACETTFALECTVSACSPAPLFTVTQGPFDYRFSFSSMANSAAASVSASCALHGPVNSASVAVCHQYASASALGQSMSGSTVQTLTGSALNYQPVPVTAGAQLLASVTGSCTASPTGGAMAAAGPTAAAVIQKVYKILVPVLIAGALV